MPARLRIAASALLLAGAAQAAERTPVALDYQANASCPDASVFLSELTARTPLARPAEPGDNPERVSVVIDEVRGGSHGQLTLAAPDGSVSQREVSAASCQQVVAALALMTALAIDPDALTSAELPAPAPPPPPPAKPAPPAQRPTAPPVAPLRWHGYGGVALELSDSVAAAPVPSVRPLVGFDRERAASFGYGFRVSGGRARGRVTRSDGAGDFTLLSARLEACPLHAPATSRLWLSGCAAFDAGQLRAAGREVSPAQSLKRPWLAGGATARLELRPVPALGLELAGGLLFPLLRDRFYVQSDSTVRRTPALVAAGALALSVRFP